MENDLKKQAEQDAARLKEKMSHIKQSFIVMSGKGGVGKTSVAVNLACALAKSGRSVGILDSDIHGPNIAKMLGIENKTVTRAGSEIEPVQVYPNLKAISLALLGFSTDQPIIWRGPLKYSAIRQFLAEVNWGVLDYLIIDSPPGTGDEPLSVCQLMPNITGAIIVSTPQDVAVLDARKTVLFAHELNIPVIGIIENMSGFFCPHCRQEINIFKTGGGENAAVDLNVPFLGRIPFDPLLVQLSDEGRPFIAANPESEAGVAFVKIVKKIESV